jgi:4-hydroxy-2-oxoheptanedioate aldolase
MAGPNAFKRKITRGERAIGIWANLGSPMTVEIIAGAGFDWVVLDAEHGPNELADILVQLQAISRHPAEPMVRVPVNDTVVFKKFLDIGVRTFLIPFVESAAEATAAVAATRYPPLGCRGVSLANRANDFGRVKGYLQHAHDDMCLCAQIESRAGLAALDAILAVEGLDAVFVGPSDLAAALGHLGDPFHPDVQAAIATITAAGRRAGKPVGILAMSEDHARRSWADGITYVAVGSDMGLVARGSEALRERYRDIIA